MPCVTCCTYCSVALLHPPTLSFLLGAHCCSEEALWQEAWCEACPQYVQHAHLNHWHPHDSAGHYAAKDLWNAAQWEKFSL